MTFKEWLTTVPSEITDDPLWRMEVYRLSLFLAEVAWYDVTRLMQDRRTLDLSGQLFRAVGSVGANISEGYGRSSRKDLARFYEYSLGSAREARTWYYGGRHVLPEAVVTHRLQFLTQIIRQLLHIIPAERGYRMEEEAVPYLAPAPVPELPELLASVPLP